MQSDANSDADATQKKLTRRSPRHIWPKFGPNFGIKIGLKKVFSSIEAPFFQKRFLTYVVNDYSNEKKSSFIWILGMKMKYLLCSVLCA